MAQQEEQPKQQSPLESAANLARTGMDARKGAGIARAGVQMAARALAPAIAAAAPVLGPALAIIGVVLIVVLFIVVILVAIGVIGGGGGTAFASPGGGLGLKEDYCQSFKSPEDLNGNGELEDCSIVLKGIILEAAAAAKMPAGVLIGIGLRENIGDAMTLTESEIGQYSAPGGEMPGSLCATSSAGARGPMQFLPSTFEGHKDFIVDVGARPDGYESKICNIKDNIYAAAHKLKSDSGIPFDEETRPWTQEEVFTAADAYHGSCHIDKNENGIIESSDDPLVNEENAYCLPVWNFYVDKRDQGISGDPNVPNGCPLRSGLIEGPGNLYGAPRPHGRLHSGIDLQGGDGAEVLATMNGLVAFSGRNNETGFMVIISNGPYKTRYLHMYSDLRVSEDEQVLRGTVIGRQDDSGSSSRGSHLHYDVFENGDKVDPTPFIPMNNQVGATCEA
ncbi:M23 family metallopeptidase [Patescibacteria group bacterium]|nr:M23 family metallopeptidase [Patescibacteria group bacterium]